MMMMVVVVVIGRQKVPIEIISTHTLRLTHVPPNREKSKVSLFTSFHLSQLTNTPSMISLPEAFFGVRQDLSDKLAALICVQFPGRGKEWRPMKSNNHLPEVIVNVGEL